jgi:PAS domain S-box-containing protein
LNNIQATVDEQLDLIEAGKFEQVESLEEERVDSSFEELDEVAEDVGATAEASALRTESIAGVGIYLITFLTTIALMAMYRLYQRRARANQRKLLESEERYRLVAQATNEVIWDYDPRTQGQMWDGATEAMFGYDPEEMGVTGEWWEDHIHPDDRERVLANTEAVPRDGREAWIEEYRFRRADSAYVTVVDRAYVVRDAEDRPVRMLGSIMDVTERKRAEEALREAEERYRTLVERIPVVTYIQEHSSPGRVIYISPQNESLLGYSTEEVLSDPEHWMRILHPDDRERVLAEDERTNQTEEPFVMEYREIARDGSVVWVKLENDLRHALENDEFTVY